MQDGLVIHRFHRPSDTFYSSYIAMNFTHFHIHFHTLKLMERTYFGFRQGMHGESFF